MKFSPCFSNKKFSLGHDLQSKGMEVHLLSMNCWTLFSLNAAFFIESKPLHIKCMNQYSVCLNFNSFDFMLVLQDTEFLVDNAEGFF